LTKLGPLLSLCDSDVHDGFLQGSFDSASDLKIQCSIIGQKLEYEDADLDFLAILVQSIFNGRPNPIFIHKLLVLWQFYGV
jgi:hypothetical protein